MVEICDKLCEHHLFILSLILHFVAQAMSYVRGKGGKVLGEGRGAGGRGVGQPGFAGEARESVVWPARDIRSTGRGGQGSGQVERQGGAKPRRRFECLTCQDNCCGLARELVRVAFKMGKITMTPKVMISFVYIVWLS